MARWRSRAVTLVLLGAGAAACAPDPQYRRNVYTTREACQRDYSDRQCEPYGTARYYGPHFWVMGGQRPLNDPGPGAYAQPGRMSPLATDVTPATRFAPAARAGFGSTGRGYGGGYRGGG